MSDAPELELLEDDAEEVEESADAVSFFGDDDQELAICTRVWRIYMRDSVEREHASPDECKREVHRALLDDNAERTRRRIERRRAENVLKRADVEAKAIAAVVDAAQPEEEASSMKTRGRGELAEQVRKGYEKFVGSNGRAPNANELFVACGGVDSVRSVENARNTAKRIGLTIAAARAAAGGVHAPKTEAPPRPKRTSTKLAKRASSNDVVRRAAPPARGVVSNGALAELHALRAELAMKLETIDKAIEVLAS